VGKAAQKFRLSPHLKSMKKSLQAGRKDRGGGFCLPWPARARGYFLGRQKLTRDKTIEMD